MPLAPPPERQDEIKFLFAKSLSYQKRMLLICLCMSVGVFIQLVYGFWLGLGLLMLGTGLSMIAGFDATPKLEHGSEKWAQVTPDEYAKVKLKADQLKKWDEDIFDGTNAWGAAFGLTVFCVLGLTAAWFYFGHEGEPAMRLGIFIAADTCLVLLPHWFTGTRAYLKKDKLILRIDVLQKMMKALEAPSDLQVLPMLSTLTTEEGGRIPNDAKLMLKFLNAPEGFMGVQVQVSINMVQGKALPYMYCVLLAKEGSCLLAGAEKLADGIPGRHGDTGLARFISFGGRDMPILTEADTNAGVDILVVRQEATKTEGYHTTNANCLRIVQFAVNLTREVLKRAEQKAAA